MFIKITKLDAVLKKAYKGAGISIERNGDILAVLTANMYIEADLRTATNEFKAIITKYLGEIPAAGYAATIFEDKEQTALKHTIYLGLFQKELDKCPAFTTDFTYCEDKVMTSEKGIFTVLGKEWSVFDERQKEDTEEMYGGWNIVNCYVVRKSDRMILAFRTMQPDAILKQLEGLPIEELPFK